MATEIERKFLPSSDAWRASVQARTLLRQGYLANNARCSVRVRVAGGDVGWLSVKAMTPGLARAEYEYPLPLAEANAMLDGLCSRPFIEKWRHIVHWRGHDWEIDEFLGDNAGLVVAEVELARVDEVPEMPPWIGPEVTQDVRFYNFSLVELPWPAFREAYLRDAGECRPEPLAVPARKLEGPGLGGSGLHGPEPDRPQQNRSQQDSEESR